MPITEEYTPGRLIDVHGDGDRGVVLLWHGKGASSRPELVGLGETIAAHGFRVAVPDWDWDADDASTALLASLAYARRLADQDVTDPHDVVLVGWSLGGTAALGLVAALDEPVARLVLLAPADAPGALVPFTGEPLPDPFPDGSERPRVDLVVPVDDDVVPPTMVRGLADRLAASGWSTTCTDLDADHWSVAMTRFDVEADRGVAADDPAALAAGHRVAAIVAEAATSAES